MQSKKITPKRPMLPKPCKSSLPSPEKPQMTRFSPNKVVLKTKFNPFPEKDFFSYTPLRTNKSLTSSTPDLKSTLTKYSKNEKTIEPQRISLDNSRLLKDKIKEFKAKVKENVNKSLTSRPSYCQISVFVNILAKKLKRLQKKLKAEVFAIFLQIFKCKVKTTLFVLRNRLKIALNGDKGIFENKVWNQKFMRLAFNYWKKFKIQVNVEDNLEHNESFEGDDKGLVQVADILYCNSLTQFFAINPWKIFVDLRKRKKRLSKLAKENHEVKLLVKGINGFSKVLMENKEKPEKFRKFFLMQKVFCFFKNFEKGDDNSLQKRFREVFYI